MAGKLKTALELAQSRKSVTSFGYNSIVSSDRRRPVQNRATNEAFFLSPQKRIVAASTARDDRRNMALLAWMVRRHIGGVSRFTPFFHIETENDSPQIDKVNSIVEKMMRWHSKPKNFDTLGRHSRDEFMWLFEATKIIGGDCAILKGQYGKLQGIEGERIAKKEDPKAPKDVGESGILFNADGTRNAFSICKRTVDGAGLEFERMIPASEMIFDGYWPERFDADRGVSPLMPGLNEAADIREANEWHLLKVKAAGIFGFAFTRKSSDSMGFGNTSTTAPEDETASYSNQVSSAIKARGLINLDLDQGDDVKAIESDSPNPNVTPFVREITRSVLLSLDIPFTFYDSLTASFSARIADRNEYEEACEWKRAKNINVLDEIYSDWLFPKWYESNFMGFGKALDAAGVSVEEAAASLAWVPAGRAWLDRAGEMQGHILAIAAGIESIPEVCAMYGKNAYTVSQEQARYLKKAQAPLLYANGGQVAVQAIMAGMASGTQPSAANGAQNASAQPPEDKPNE